MRKPKIIAIVGTNASGKSSLGLDLANRYKGEIVSADSRQIYNGFDLCSGKVSLDEMTIVPHHLINVCHIGDNYSVADYQEAAYQAIDQILEREHIPFIVGGTGLYVDSVIKGYGLQNENIDYSLRNELSKLSITELQELLKEYDVPAIGDNSSESNNSRRLIRRLEKAIKGQPQEVANCPRFEALQIGLTWPRETLCIRIEERLSKRIELGMLDEVIDYLKDGGNPDYLVSLGLEYRHIYKYVSGEYPTFDVFFEEMARAIRRFAKKQMSWFKRNPNIIWLETADDKDFYAEAESLIGTFLVQ